MLRGAKTRLSAVPRSEAGYGKLVFPFKRGAWSWTLARREVCLVQAETYWSVQENYIGRCAKLWKAVHIEANQKDGPDQGKCGQSLKTRILEIWFSILGETIYKTYNTNDLKTPGRVYSAYFGGMQQGCSWILEKWLQAYRNKVNVTMQPIEDPHKIGHVWRLWMSWGVVMIGTINICMNLKSIVESEYGDKLIYCLGFASRIRSPILTIALQDQLNESIYHQIRNPCLILCRCAFCLCYTLPYTRKFTALSKASQSNSIRNSVPMLLHWHYSTMSTSFHPKFTKNRVSDNN